MAMRDVPIVRRYILLDVPSTCSIIVNRNDVITLNAGRYQIDSKENVQTLEADELVDVQYSPADVGWLTGLNGLPVSGPLTYDQDVRRVKAYQLAVGTILVSTLTGVQDIVIVSAVPVYAGGDFTSQFLVVVDGIEALVAQFKASAAYNAFAPDSFHGKIRLRPEDSLKATVIACSILYYAL